MTEPKELITHARVRLVIDVKLPQPFDINTTADHIFRRAVRDAKETISSHFQTNVVSIVKDPEVFMVTAEKSKD